MRKITIILMMLFASYGFAQNAPIDFEDGGFGADWTWTVFENESNPPLEIIANPDASGGNTSATVAKFTALQAGNPWAGVESSHGDDELGTFLLDETNSTIKIMVWKPIISDVGIKLATASGWAQPELKVANTVVNEWEELTFDFSDVINNPDGEMYDQIIIFPDHNARTQDNIVYFDNITFHAQQASSDEPTVAAPAPPSRDPEDVISIFSDAYTDLDGTNFNPPWGQSTIVSTEDIEGNATLKYSNFNYQGIEFAAPINATDMETLHVDMWTGDASAVNIFTISTGPVEVAYALPLTTGEWISYDIPLTAFDGVDMADVIQFKFDGGDGSPTIYLDNIYFYKGGDAPPVGEGPRNPIDFEAGGYGADWTWTVFENESNPPLEIIANPDASGGNTSATVAKFTALQAGNPWAGVESSHGDAELGTFLLDETNSTIKIMVWKSVISDVGIKLATASGWAQPELKVANTVVNEWEELTFDFSDVINNPDGELYDQIIIFPDHNARTQDNIVYFDNITFNPTSGGEEGDDASLSDLQVDGTTVAGFSSTTLDYSVTLPEGTTEVPTVTATTTDEDASAVVNPANEIPGTTSIVVTSANTNVEQTYTVAFSIQSAGEEGPRNPIDFEAGGYGADWTWSVFENEANPPLEIIANPDASGGNTSATVAKFTALQAGNPWAGVESSHGDDDLGTFLLDETNSTIKIMVWKPEISDVGVKLVSPTGWAQPEIKVANTVVNQWEELTFDFSNIPNPPTEEGGVYDQIVIFPDWKDDGREQDNIIYFDNITFNTAGSGPAEGPAVAAPTPPDREAEDVISVFSDAYTDVADTDFNPAWGQSTVVSTIVVEDNPTLKYADFDFQGTQLASPLNVSDMQTMHLDMWTDDATTVTVYTVSTGPVETGYSLDITSGEWESYDIALTEFAGVDLADVVQLKFDGGDGSPTIYLDNIYFYKDETSVALEQKNTLHLYPNPVTAGDRIQLDADVSQVDVFDFAGRNIISVNSSVISTEMLEQGVYLVKIQLANGDFLTQKLVVK